MMQSDSSLYFYESLQLFFYPFMLQLAFSFPSMSWLILWCHFKDFMDMQKFHLFYCSQQL